VTRCLPESILCLLLSVTAHAATLRYWVEPCAAAADVCHSGDPELAQWAMEAWQSGSGGRGGLYGEARPIVVDGVRGAEVYVVTPAERIDDELLRDTIVYLTCLHETGHALGLPHTAAFADIMYNFQFGGDIAEYFGRYRRKLAARADIRKNSGISDDDRKELISLLR
jgi:hypothetical protein